MAIDGELPDDVLKEILSGLPVKSLLRFLSVSKYWYSFILSPSFVSLQRNRAASIAKDTNADCLLIKRFPHDGGDNLLCEPDGNETSLFYDKLYNKLVLSLVPVETPVGDLDISFTGLNVRDLNLLHSSNGLVLCAANRSTIVICNPAMREVRVLPQPPYESRRTTHLGFGFDPISEDYKVIRVARLNRFSI